MRKICVLLSLLAAIGLGASKGTPQDEQSIRKVMADWTEAWSRHDAKAASKHYHEDAQFTPPPGKFFGNRADIEKTHVEAFAGDLKAARLTTTVDEIRFVRPDVAIVSGTFAVTGADLPVQPKGPQLVVLTKEKGQWAIAAHQLMIPLPSGPPPGK